MPTVTRKAAKNVDVHSMQRFSSAVNILTVQPEAPEYRMVWNPGEDAWAQVIEIIEEEKWGAYNPDQFRLIRNYEKQNTVVAMTDQGQVLGCMMYIIQPDINQAYVSYYIVAKEFRGRGIAGGLWEAVMGRENPKITGRLLTVDTFGMATMEMRRRRGFIYSGPKTLRCLGLNHLIHDATQEYLASSDDDHHDCPIQICKIESGKLPSAFLEYDKAVSGRDRKDFYDAYCAMPSFQGFYALHSQNDREEGHAEAGKCLGVCFASKAAGSVRIGPLYADSMAVALKLLGEATKAIPLSSQLMFHLPASNSEFLYFLESKACFAINFVMNRSYTHRYIDKCDRSKIFSYSSHVCQHDC